MQNTRRKCTFGGRIYLKNQEGLKLKKTVYIFSLVLVLLFGTSLMCFAQNIDDKELGISFELSDAWVNTSTDQLMVFKHNVFNQEQIAVETIYTDWAYSIDLVEESELQQLCDNIYSDYNLGTDLSKTNNALVSVKSDSVSHRYEYYNGVKYFRYEKAYTATALSYKPTAFYDTIFLTAKNGKVYVIKYLSNSERKYFNDVVNMLNSISFANGEIKIKINNELVVSDSAPMIVKDRTLVPIRAVAEKMGYSVSWNAEMQLVTLISNDGLNIIHFQIGNDTAYKNLSEEITLAVPPVIFENRTYLPLRDVAEAMDANVNWNGSEKTVEITK